MLYYGFILPDGTELKMEGKISTHEKLAEKFIQDKGLQRDYKKSNSTTPIDYLVIDWGAIKVGNLSRSDTITVTCPYYSEIIETKVREYRENGYRIDRIFLKDYNNSY